ncbi:MAG: hypothetical protein GEEBNDBF_02553 [bacterium]|nr:hypothetical protein [bacterium]
MKVTNCPEAICSLLTPNEAICCGDEYCQFVVVAIHTYPYDCTCPECEDWVNELIQSGQFFEWCFGDGRVSCERESEQCCPD